MASQNFSDLYYPSVLTPNRGLDAGAVDGALKRAFDMIYKMNPPNGSGSSLLSNFGFIDEFTIKLGTKKVTLADQVFAASTTGAVVVGFPSGVRRNGRRCWPRASSS